MLKVVELRKEFKSFDHNVVAVDGISFTLPVGVFAAIVGKSGSGKSTLLALLGALDKPTSGSIEMAERDITKLSDRALIDYRRRQVGFVFQDYNLVPNLTALQNVMLPMEFAGLGRRGRKKRAALLLDQIGITGSMQKRKPRRLSGGEQQRVAIARALANKPKLILADEPTGNLDSETGKIIIDLLHNLARSEETTIIAVTHDVGISNQTDKTYHLRDGKLVDSLA